jgi:asparagine synthase (glutamine-hydrolysing)
MEVQTPIYDNSNWYKKGETMVSGSAFYDGTVEHIDTETFCSKLQRSQSVSEVMDIVNRVSGFYAFIHNLEDKVIASVDHIRSIPLYYSTEEAIITDNPREIVGEVDPAYFAPVPEAEYLLTGYVTGKETLCPAVNTLEAGTLAMIDKDSGNININQHTEYYPSKPDRSNDLENDQEELKQAISQAVERLCVVASDRPIYLLLSGGHDSKLILSELVKQEYDPVVALSFGRPDNSDVTMSETIANAVDVERKYVEYTGDTWNEWFRSDTRKEYCKLRHNMDFIPVHWAGPALSELERRDELPDDAVFVSGQTVGSIGEHMPSKEQVRTRSELIDYILDNHYVLWGRNAELSNTLRDRIDRNLKTGDDLDFIPMYEQWEWKERQSKWMSQDGSLYSFFGYDWWFPLFDKEVLKAWENSPREDRQQKQALIDISETSFNQVANVGSALESGRPDLTDILKQRITNSPVGNIARYFHEYYRQSQGFGSHPLGYEGMFGPGQPGEYYCGNQNHHSYIAMHAVDRMSFSPPDASGVPKDCELSIEKIRQLPRITDRN